MTAAFGELLVAGLRRATAAQLILVFGNEDSRRQVAALSRQDVSDEQKEAIRAGLDRVADGLFT